MKGLPDWAREVPTPALVYDFNRLEKDAVSFRTMASRQGISCSYAIKANRNRSVLKELARQGFGADVASEAEFQAAEEAGFRRINATSPGLSGRLCARIVNAGGMVFFDHREQLEAARSHGVRTEIQGIRLSLGGAYGQFGFTSRDLTALRTGGAVPRRVHVHVGERLDLQTLKSHLNAIRPLLDDIRPDLVDLGGGFGVLSNDPHALSGAFELIGAFSREIGADAVIEPGKAIVARCGFLVATVVAVKRRAEGRIVVIDASSYNLGDMEPRRLVAATERPLPAGPAMVIGPTCYEGDIWGRFDLPDISVGDRLLFGLTGAYTASIAGSLHGLPVPEEHILPNGSQGT
ncbi:MAG: diaminopimelate decarboxylase [Roseibium sp.]